MKKASEYRQHAAECRALAAQMQEGDQRDQLMKMAETWESLAQDRERFNRKLQNPQNRSAGGRDPDTR